MHHTHSTPVATATLEENPKSELLNPKYPLHLFPAPFRDQIQGLSATTGAPLEFTATAFLGTLSAALCGSARLVGTPRQVRPNLYTVLELPSSPGCATVFRALRQPLLDEQREINTRWRRQILPKVSFDRYLLQSARTAARAKNRTAEDAARDYELREIETDLHFLRTLANRQPVLFLTGLHRQPLLQRLGKSACESVALLSSTAAELLPLLDPSPKHALVQSIFTAGHESTPISLDLNARRSLFLSEPRLSLLATVPPGTPLYTPKTLAHSPLLPKFLSYSASAAHSHSLPLPKHPQTIPTNPLVPSDLSDPLDPLDPSPAPACADPSNPSDPSNSQPAPDPEQNPKSKILNPKFPYRSTIRDLVYLHRCEIGRDLFLSPEAADVLEAYERECQDRAGTDLADLPTYAHAWADNAWRLALLLHCAELTLFPAPCTCPQSCNCLQHAQEARASEEDSATASASASASSSHSPTASETEATCHPSPNSNPSAPSDSAPDQPSSSPEETTPNTPPAPDPKPNPKSEPSGARQTAEGSPQGERGGANQTPNPKFPNPSTPGGRLLSLLRYLGPLPELPPDTAALAVALMRWYSAHQLAQLAPARERFHLEQVPDLARVIDCLRRCGGATSLGELRHTLRLPPAQARALASAYPDLLQLTSSPRRRGRPKTTISLLIPIPPPHRVPISGKASPPPAQKMPKSENPEPSPEPPPAPTSTSPEASAPKKSTSSDDAQKLQKFPPAQGGCDPATLSRLP